MRHPIFLFNKHPLLGVGLATSLALSACSNPLPPPAVATPTHAAQAGKLFDGPSMLPGMVSPLAVQFMLPEDVACIPSGEIPDLSQGVFWGRRETVEAIKQDRNRNLNTIGSPVFLVRLSSDVAQISPDNFSHESQLQSSAKSLGLTQVTIRKLKWGTYPVLAMTGCRPDGSLAATAWVGINQETWVMQIDYRHASGDGHPTPEERAIWDQFLNHTTPMSLAQRVKAQGFDMQDGRTLVKLAASHDIFAEYSVRCEQRKSDGKIAIRIEVLNAHTKLTVKGAEPVTSPEFGTFYGVLADGTVSTGNATLHLMDVRCPVTVKKVEAFSFSGSPMAETSAALFYGTGDVTMALPPN